MGLAEAVVRGSERRGADPTLPWGSSYIPTNAQTGLSAAGIAINDDMAYSITTVASCVRMLADSASGLDLLALKKTKDRSRKLIDPPPPVIQNPWPEGTLQDWLVQVVNSIAMRGNFFGKIVDRDADGYPTIIMPIHPDWVVAMRSPSTGKRRYWFWGRPVDTNDVFHIPSALLPAGSFIGLNPIEYQRSAWGLAAAAEKYGGQFYANSANPSGILSTEQDLSEDETIEWLRSWRASHGGLQGAGLPAILTGGAKWTQISITPDDAQFLQTRTFQREQIISWFGIPPHKIGIMDRTPGPTDVEGLEMLYIQDAVVPYTSRIENYLSRPEITRPSQEARFDFSSRLRSNTLQRMQAWQIAGNSGILTIDELRAMENKEPLPKGMGNIVLRPMNMTAYDLETGEPVPGPAPDPSKSPINPGGLGGQGGDPANSPGSAKPSADPNSP